MSEPQAEYDTDTEPSYHTLMQRQIATGGVVQLVEDTVDGKEVAVLLGTVGEAAKKVEEMGYDPVAAVEALPELLEAAGKLIESAEQEFGESRFASSPPKLLESPSRETIDALKDALASAEGKTND